MGIMYDYCGNEFPIMGRHTALAFLFQGTHWRGRDEFVLSFNDLSLHMDRAGATAYQKSPIEREAEKITEQKLLANPAPLGLMGFGMTTVLLNLHNAGLFDNNTMIFAMGIFYGGLAQIIAGILEFRKGNTFGTTAFISFGSFWLTLVFIWLVGASGKFAGPDDNAFAWYLLVWGVFTAFMFIGTLKKNRILQFIFGSLTILFLLLAVEHWMMHGGISAAEHVGTVAGIEGVLCGASAIYLAMAEVLNEAGERTMLPIFPVNT